MLTKEMLDDARESFDELEKRKDYYTKAVELKDAGFMVHAAILLLGTWNFAAFRYAVNGDLDLLEFEKALSELKPKFDLFKNENISAIDLNKYEEEIKFIYSKLAVFPGVLFTGAAKLMHLFSPSVFVMWDGFIRGDKLKSQYKDLGMEKLYRKYKTTPEDYHKFLKDMQNEVKDIEIDLNEKKYLAKRIDEYNYVNITLKIQDMGKEILKNKKVIGDIVR